MSKRVKSQDAKSKKLKKRSVDEAKTEIVSTVIELIMDILKHSREDKDCTDGIIDTIIEIFQPVSDKFKDLIEENKGEKSSVGGLIKIFTILLS